MARMPTKQSSSTKSSKELAYNIKQVSSKITKHLNNNYMSLKEVNKQIKLISRLKCNTFFTEQGKRILGLLYKIQDQIIQSKVNKLKKYGDSDYDDSSSDDDDTEENAPKNRADQHTTSSTSDDDIHEEHVPKNYADCRHRSTVAIPKCMPTQLKGTQINLDDIHVGINSSESIPLDFLTNRNFNIDCEVNESDPMPTSATSIVNFPVQVVSELDISSGSQIVANNHLECSLLNIETDIGMPENTTNINNIHHSLTNNFKYLNNSNDLQKLTPSDFTSMEINEPNYDSFERHFNAIRNDHIYSKPFCSTQVGEIYSNNNNKQNTYELNKSHHSPVLNETGINQSLGQVQKGDTSVNIFTDTENHVTELIEPEIITQEFDYSPLINENSMPNIAAQHIPVGLKKHKVVDRKCHLRNGRDFICHTSQSQSDECVNISDTESFSDVSSANVDDFTSTSNLEFVPSSYSTDDVVFKKPRNLAPKSFKSKQSISSFPNDSETTIAIPQTPVDYGRKSSENVDLNSSFVFMLNAQDSGIQIPTIQHEVSEEAHKGKPGQCASENYENHNAFPNIINKDSQRNHEDFVRPTSHCESDDCVIISDTDVLPANLDASETMTYSINDSFTPTDSIDFVSGTYSTADFVFKKPQISVPKSLETKQSISSFQSDSETTMASPQSPINSERIMSGSLDMNSSFLFVLTEEDSGIEIPATELEISDTERKITATKRVLTDEINVSETTAKRRCFSENITLIDGNIINHRATQSEGKSIGTIQSEGKSFGSTQFEGKAIGSTKCDGKAIVLSDYLINPKANTILKTSMNSSANLTQEEQHTKFEKKIERLKIKMRLKSLRKIGVNIFEVPAVAVFNNIHQKDNTTISFDLEEIYDNITSTSDEVKQNIKLLQESFENFCANYENFEESFSDDSGDSDDSDYEVKRCKKHNLKKLQQLRRQFVFDHREILKTCMACLDEDSDDSDDLDYIVDKFKLIGQWRNFTAKD